MNPVDAHYRSLVILTRKGFRFEVVASGLLEHDGQSVQLKTDGATRIITDNDLAGCQPVIPGNRIAECRGFDFFLLID